MPKHQRESSSSGSESDGPDDRLPVKKNKTNSGSEDKSAKNSKTESQSEWHLGNNRFVKISEFRGKLLVDIREFYEKEGKTLPGKKGISLNASQWKKFKEIVDEVDNKLSEF